MLIRLLVLSAVILSHTVWGAPARAEGKTPSAVTEHAVTALEINAPSAEKLAVQSKLILRFLHQKEDGNASEQMELLQQSGLQLGYENFPQLSASLIDMARGEQGMRLGFLVRKAVALSPSDPRIHLLAGSFVEELGLRESFANVSKGAALLWRHPSLVAACVSELFVTFLVALFVSLLFLCAVQLAVYGSDIVEGIGDRFPKSFYGFAGPLGAFLLLVPPLFGGALVTLCGWSFVLGWFVPRCRWLLALVGTLIVSWGFSVVMVTNVTSYWNSRTQSALEEMNNASFADDHLAVLGSIKSPDLATLSSVGAELLRMRNFTDARRVLESALGMTSNGTPAHHPLLVNLALLSYLERDFAKSKELLERATNGGIESFEASYLAAQVSLKLTDLTEQERFYVEAKAIDPVRLSKLQSNTDEASPYVPVILAQAPRGIFYKRFIRPAEMFDPQGVNRRLKGSSEISTLLLKRANPLHVVWFGLATILLGVLLRIRTPDARYELRTKLLGERSEKISQIWALLPGGLFLAGRNPILGLGIVAGAFWMFLLASELPLQLPVAAAMYHPFRPIMLCLALAGLTAASLSSLRHRAMRAR